MVHRWKEFRLSKRNIAPPMGGARPPSRNSPAFLRHFGSLARRPALRGAQARVFANPVPANISVDHKLNRCNTKALKPNKHPRRLAPAPHAARDDERAGCRNGLFSKLMTLFGVVSTDDLKEAFELLLQMSYFRSSCL